MSERYPPIADYGLISDCHSSGLVSRYGSVDWACFRRFDGPAVFARLLSWDDGGHCALAPVGAEPAGRRYVDGTMVLETQHRSGQAQGRTVDFFAVSDRSHASEARSVHPYHQMIRIAEATSGTTEWEFLCRPRFEYGFVHPLASVSEEGTAGLIGGPGSLAVNASVPLEAGDGEVLSRFRLEEGQIAWFALTWHPASEAREEDLDEDEIRNRLRCTTEFWEEWSGICSYDGPHRDDVIRSALVLKALTNAPSGAIVAAPTTSLPEDIGGMRNWDYRYCWLRDSSYTLYALFILGYTSEARDFLDWLVRTTAGRAEELQVLYGVGGERFIPEHVLEHLEGYRGSPPVRVGNAAGAQFQLDIYGEVLDAAHLWRRHGGRIDEEFWGFLRGCVDQIAKRWQEPDSGLWETRAELRHYVYSKAMCWVGVDRAVRAAEEEGLEAPIDEWKALRREIRDDVMENGFDDELGSFVQSYGSKDLDASALLLPLVGFLKHDDPRVASTVDRIQERLRHGDHVRRYLSDDGLEGDEGSFTICSFWLVDNLALLGRVEEAEQLFDRLCESHNDLSLFAEEIDPETGEHLGNFPQAFTHLALINSALNLQRMRQHPGERPRPVEMGPAHEHEAEPVKGEPPRRSGRGD